MDHAPGCQKRHPGHPRAVTDRRNWHLGTRWLGMMGTWATRNPTRRSLENAEHAQANDASGKDADG